MKFFVAVGVMAAFAAAMAAGIVLAVQGSPWLLVASVGLFGLLFWRIGCTEP
jgi:hypothetical protein